MIRIVDVIIKLSVSDCHHDVVLMSNQSRCSLTPSPISPHGDQSLASRLLGGRDVVGVSYRPLLEQRQGLRAKHGGMDGWMDE